MIDHKDLKPGYYWAKSDIATEKPLFLALVCARGTTHYIITLGNEDEINLSGYEFHSRIEEPKDG